MQSPPLSCRTLIIHSTIAIGACAGTGGVFSIFLRGWDYLIAVAAVYAAMFTPRWMLALVQLAGVFAHPAGAGEIPEDAYQ